MKSKGLGRGLSALMGENLLAEDSNSSGLNHILLQNIIPNPKQPRVIFKGNELEELANSIRQNGILQPILVQSTGKDQYQIIAGERRWRAAKMVGLASIPAIIKEMSEQEALEIALIENIQRENLTPLEEAESYKKLINEYNYTQEKMAEIVSKSRSHIANLLRLINLPEKVKNYLNNGLISLGHAKLLVNQKDAEQFADLIVTNNLNVREAEDLVRDGVISHHGKQPHSTKRDYSASKDEDIIALEHYLSDALGMLVKIDRYPNGGSKLSIHCAKLEELDDVVQKLSSAVT